MYADPLTAIQSQECVATDHETAERSDRSVRVVLARCGLLSCVED
jgi:hypothetical protein